MSGINFGGNHEYELKREVNDRTEKQDAGGFPARLDGKPDSQNNHGQTKNGANDEEWEPHHFL